MPDRRFDAATLELLRERSEVHLETASSEGARHQAIVWIVVDSFDRVLVRSYRGPRARWYREATSGRPVALRIDGEPIAVSVVSASDPDRVASCTRELVRKYRDDPSTPGMIRDEVLGTTLELVPAVG